MTLLLSAVEISWELPSYDVVEGLTARLCADIVTGTNVIPIVVDISTASGATEGEPVIIAVTKSEYYVNMQKVTLKLLYHHN